MIPVMYSSDLAGMKCSTPGCNHTSHGGHKMFIHQSCHFTEGVEFEFILSLPNLPLAHISCAVCGKTVAYIAIDNYGQQPPYVSPPCHPGEPWFVAFNNGRLDFICKSDDHLIFSVRVLEKYETNLVRDN